MVKKRKAKRDKVKEDRGTAVEYPAIDLDTAINLIRKAYAKGKDSIMTFEEINKNMGVKGGSRSVYTNSLKLYGLAEKTELGWQITNIGKRVAVSDVRAIASAFLIPEINTLITKIFNGKKPTPDALIAFLKRQNVKSADVIARRYLRGFEYITKINPFLVTLDADKILSKEAAKITKDIEKKNTDIDVYKMAIEVGRLFKPLSQQDIKAILEELLKMSEKHNMKQFAVIIKNLKDKSETLNEEDLKKELASISQIAIQIFENELG